MYEYPRIAIQLCMSDRRHRPAPRPKKAGPPYSICCHRLLATGNTTYLKSGGTLELGQQIAAHEASPTTKLNDRIRGQVSVEEVEQSKSEVIHCIGLDLPDGRLTSEAVFSE